MRIDSNGASISEGFGRYVRALVEEEHGAMGCGAECHHVMADHQIYHEAERIGAINLSMRSSTWRVDSQIKTLFGLPLYVSSDVPQKSILFFDKDRRLIASIVNIGTSEAGENG